MFSELRLLALLTATSAFDLELISTIPNNVSLGVALPWTGAGLDLAADNVRERFGNTLNLSVTRLYRGEDRDCVSANANALFLLAEYYYTTKADNRCVAVISSACGGHAVSPFLAKEWNVLMFSNSLVSTRILNSIDTPTSIGMPSSYQGLALALLKFFWDFKWFHVTLLKETSGTTEFYWETFDATKSLAASSEYKQFMVDGIAFDRKDKLSIIKALTFASRRSRVFLILANTVVVIELLVFMVFQPLQQSVYGSVTLFDYPAKEDKGLFHSVIFLTIYGGSRGSNSDVVNQLLVDRERTAYGKVMETGVKPLDLFSIRETYNSVELFAALVNESRHLKPQQGISSKTVCSGTALMPLMRNRTFRFPSGQIYVNSDGYRHADLLLYALMPMQEQMEPVARYDSVSGNFTWISNMTAHRFHSTRDTPLCGFSNLEGPCHPNINEVTVILPVIFFLVILIPFAVGLVMRRRLCAGLNEQWWKCDGSLLIIHVQTVQVNIKETITVVRQPMASPFLVPTVVLKRNRRNQRSTQE